MSESDAKTARDCQRCEGCGKIASGCEGAPWSRWAAMPLGSCAAVILGIVKPITCPDCLGLGDKAAADAVRTLKQLGYTGDEVEAAWRSLFGNAAIANAEGGASNG